jgi:hypothetical protein
MLVLHPRRVKFGAAGWESVQYVAIERAAQRSIVEFGDEGRGAVFADVPEERVSVRVAQSLEEDDLSPPKCGDRATIVFYTSASGSEARRLKVSADVVVRGVSYEISAGRGVTRFVSMVALSSDGAADPITRTEAGAEV